MSDTTIDEIFNKLTYGYEFQMSDYAGSREQELEYERQGKAEIAQAKSALYDLILKEVVANGIDTSTWPDDVPATDLHYAHGFNTCLDRAKYKLKELFNE